METKKNVYEKLQEARIELQKKNNKKSGKNKFANFNYYELGDFLPSINEIFNNLKLTSLFNIEDEKAILKIVNIENIEESIIFTSPIADAQIKGANEIQCLGGIHTYMRRYLYMNALEIVESDMFDAVSGDKTKQIEKKEKQEDYRQKLIDFCKLNNQDMNEIAQKYRLNSKSKNEEFETVLHYLEEVTEESNNLLQEKF